MDDLFFASALMLAGGLLAGGVGGLLGLGGGIVLMPLLRFGAGLPPALAAGTCVVAVFFTTLGGAYRHWRLGHLQLGSLTPVVVAGALAATGSSIAFGLLAGRGHWLDLGIGLVFALIALRMITEACARLLRGVREEGATARLPGGWVGKAGIGAVAGVLPGLLGIGTGGVLVPAFAIVLRAPIKTAMAASLACFSVNAFISASFKLGQGYVDATLALPACVGTLLGANLGALLNGRFPAAVVRLMFGLVFSYVAVRFLFNFFGAIS